MLSWLAVLMLVFQLGLAGWHQHDAHDPVPDCAICHVAGQTLDLPPATPPVIAALLVLVACLLAQRAQAPLPGAPTYVRPPGRAPPVHA